MDLPVGGSVGKRVCRSEPLIALCRVVARCWDPDVGQVWSHKLDEHVAIPPDGIDVGWLTYIGERGLALPEFDKRIEVLPVKGLGHLIVATRQRFSTKNANHIKRAKLVAAALNRRAAETASESLRMGTNWNPG